MTNSTLSEIVEKNVGKNRKESIIPHSHMLSSFLLEQTIDGTNKRSLKKHLKK